MTNQLRDRAASAGIARNTRGAAESAVAVDDALIASNNGDSLLHAGQNGRRLIPLLGQGANGAIQLLGCLIHRAGKIGQLIFGVVQRKRLEVAIGYPPGKLLETADPARDSSEKEQRSSTGNRQD